MNSAKKFLLAVGLSTITIILLARRATSQEPPPEVIREPITITWQ